MLKRDRTADEKRVDKLTRSGIMRLGAQPSPGSAEFNPFPYVLGWDRMGRKGARCKVIHESPRHIMIEFEDGFQSIIDRRAIRRV